MCVMFVGTGKEEIKFFFVHQKVQHSWEISIEIIQWRWSDYNGSFPFYECAAKINLWQFLSSVKCVEN